MSDWQPLETCPLDLEVWLVDRIDGSPYLGKKLKVGDIFKDEVKDKLFCAHENRTAHPNPYMWAHTARAAPPKLSNAAQPEAQDGRHSVIPYDPAKGMPGHAPERGELHYTAKIHAEIRAISGVLVLMSKRLDRIEDRQKKIVDGKAPQPTSNLDETS